MPYQRIVLARMMSPTHIGIGIALATPVWFLAPELAVPAALGGIVGGIGPDLDMFVGEHRRTLHFPVYYWIAALPAIAIAWVSLHPIAVFAALALVSAAVHSIMDWFGAGPEARPWLRTTPHAVYLHPRKRWLEAKYWVRYDGSPGDLVLSLVCLLPAIVLYDGTVEAIAAIAIAFGLVYSVGRKRIPDYVTL